MNLLIFSIAICLSMLTGELFLRFTGFCSPWIDRSGNEFALLAKDETLGWKHNSGAFTLPPFSLNGQQTRYTLQDDGSRLTTGGEVVKHDKEYDIVFVGGSFTEGYAVSDGETFASLVQSKFPTLNVGNFGVCGYGTYQSLLLMRQLFEKKIKPSIVIYGFIPLHEDRNVALASWLRQCSQSSDAGLPFCYLNKQGGIVEHQPINYPVFPFRENLALVDFFAKVYYKFLDTDDKKKRKDAFEITTKLISEMNNLAKKNDTSFVVALLGQTQQRGLSPEKYMPFFEASGIKTVDCRLYLEKKYIVEGDGHPNKIAHSFWAGRISTFIETQTIFQKMFKQATN